MTEKKEKDVKTILEETDSIHCVIQKAIYLLDEFIEGPMCGRCLPCPMASYEMRVLFNRISEGEGTREDIDAIRRLAPDMVTASMCKKGKDIAKFIEESLENSRDDYEQHIEKVCPQRVCKLLFTYRIIPEKCVMCGDCQEVCKDNAVIGEKKVFYKSGYLPFEIVEKRCTRCGECIKVCQYGAIEIVDEKELVTV